jgi:NADH-quinone oxidoreductase subunit J
LFVVMLLGAERDEEDANPIRWQTPVAITMAVLLIGEIIWVLVRQSQDSLARVGSSDSDFGSPAQIAQALFTTHLLPFEVASFVLLTALIGVVVLHQRQS